MSHRTARGREFNMQAFASARGDTIAVGNSGQNARGDLLGPGGKIIAEHDQIEKQANTKNTRPSSTKVKINPSEYEIGRKEVIGADGVARWEVMFADGSVEIIEKLDDSSTSNRSFDIEPNSRDL